MNFLKREMDFKKSLKLDSSYRPLEVIDSLEALVLCLCGKAVAVEKYCRKIKTVKESFQLPAVIVLNKMVKFRYSGLSPNKHNVFWRDNYQCQYCGVKCTPKISTIVLQVA